MAEGEAKSVLREVTPEAIAEARAILAGAGFGALATLTADGHPAVSRVGVAMLPDLSPLLLVSSLAGHTRALAADPRCSLLVGEPGKGDPLAHPRVMLRCRAEAVAAAGRAEARAVYLLSHPKAQLYVDFADFAFVRLAVEAVSFNGGFGRAYAISGGEWIG